MNMISGRMLAGVGVAVAFGLSAGPALADSGGVSPYSPTAGSQGTPALAASTNATSPFYGGETGAPADGVTSVGSTFKVPNFGCPEDADVLFGNAIYDTQDGVQAGAALEVSCSDGVASYGLNVFTDVGGSDVVTEGVAPGDKIIVSTYETQTNTVATVTDATSGVSDTSQDGTGDATGYPSDSYVTGIFDDSGTIPKFGSFQFRKVLVNGEHLGQTDPTALDLESGTDLQIKTAPTPEPSGSVFTLTFKHAS
jgi:hypothetical protein